MTLNDKHTLVWAVTSVEALPHAQVRFNVEAIYPTFDDAKLCRDDMQSIWPDRKFDLQVTFVRNPSL